MPVLEPIISAILYPVFTYIGLKFVAKKMLGKSLKEFRIDKPKLKWYWCITALLLPIFVIVLFVLYGGSVSALNTDISRKIVIAISGVAYYSIAAGIVEEMVFRGAIMGALEKEFNLPIAIMLPSILFGVVHIFGNSLSINSVIQLIVAGTLVGVMFSLVMYESGNFWNNAMIHALWNMSTIGIFHVGQSTDEYSLYTLIVNSNSMLITGGDFGTEASLFAIIGYMMVSLIAIILIKDRLGSGIKK